MRLKSLNETETILRLLKAERDKVVRDLQKIEEELKRDPLSELINVRQAAAEIMNDKSLSRDQMIHKLKPFADREKKARALLKHGWCIIKHQDRKYEIQCEAEQLQAMISGWQYRFDREQRKIHDH